MHVAVLVARNEAVRHGFVDHAKVSRFKLPKVDASKVLGDGKSTGEKPKVLTAEEFSKLMEHATRFDHGGIGRVLPRPGRLAIKRAGGRAGWNLHWFVPSRAGNRGSRN